MKKNHFDLIVLGGGSGGIASAIRATQYGAKVLVVEKNHLGGTCVNLGCIPKKIMYHAAAIAESIYKGMDYGFSFQAPKLDWRKLVNRRNLYIDKLREQYQQRFDELKIQSIKGSGSFYDDTHSILVDDTVYNAKHVIIATGGEPALPNINGIHHVIDSDGFFALNKQPNKVAVIGSGYIGIELAGILHSLSCETHLLVRGDNPLSRFDPMLGTTLLEIMKSKGINIHLNHQAQTIDLHSDGRKSILCSKGSVINGIDVIIAAVGRKPQTSHLNLSKIGIETDEQGFIIIDDYQNASVEGVYALGDATNAPALTPVAIAAGRHLADRLFGGQPQALLDYSKISTVVFSQPPLGTIGLSEPDAIKLHGKSKIKIYQTRFSPLINALGEDKTPVVIKLVTLKPTEQIIGLHIIGAHADELLQGFAVALTMGACKKDFDNTMAIHPTVAEELVTMTSGTVNE
jgi:glutathione reductase (NADPH)